MRFVSEQVGRLNEQLRLACGPDMLDALRQDSLEDLCLNPDGALWEKKTNADWSTVTSIGEDAAYEIVQAVAALRRAPLNDDSPVLETIFPIDESRFEAIIPPITRRPVFSLRVKKRHGFTFGSYEAQNILTQGFDLTRTEDTFIREVSGRAHKEILLEAVMRRKTVLYVGPTGSGKTTLADAHLTEIGKLTNDRVVYIEDTPELTCDVPNSVDLLANDRLDMLGCVKTAMRLRPRRIVVGEVRGKEAHALLKAWNTGHPGGVATIHADDAYSGLLRLESLVAESTTSPQQSLIAQAIDLVVFIEETSAGRKVREIIAVTGFSGDRYQFVRL